MPNEFILRSFPHFIRLLSRAEMLKSYVFLLFLLLGAAHFRCLIWLALVTAKFLKVARQANLIARTTM